MHVHNGPCVVHVHKTGIKSFFPSHRTSHIFKNTSTACLLEHRTRHHSDNTYRLQHAEKNDACRTYSQRNDWYTRWPVLPIKKALQVVGKESLRKQQLKRSPHTSCPSLKGSSSLNSEIQREEVIRRASTVPTGIRTKTTRVKGNGNRGH